jgi:DDE superfamily endonuclease/Archaeal putative transposase ISC1217
MTNIPLEALSLLQPLAPAFTEPTFRRFAVLLLAAILTTGCRTVSNLLRTAGTLAPGDPSAYHRVLSQARWHGLRLAALLARLVLLHLGRRRRIERAGDDTVCEHKGKHVWGKGRHRDPVRSRHSYTAYRWGHKGVVLAVLVRFPFATRPWALPLLVALARTKKDNAAAGRRHKTPADLCRQMLGVRLRWFPRPRFVFAGDSGYGSHALARFAQRRAGRLTLVSRFHADAALYAPPPPYTGKGRPRVKGERQPSPEQVGAATAARRRLTVRWYGGGWRRVEVVSAVGHWYQSGAGLVAVRWVYVKDRTGTHRDDYFYSTDVSRTPRQIIETYTGRWNLETTFQELRAPLGLETTRGRCRPTGLRAEPCRFGLYGVVALWYAQLPAAERGGPGVAWTGKAGVTFSDALAAVRRWLWRRWVFASGGHGDAFEKLPGPLQQLLLQALAPAA